MANMNIERDAKVQATDGAVGEVKHVVVDGGTKEVTHLVVEHNGQQSMIPMTNVARVDGHQVFLSTTRQAATSAARFDRNAYVDLDADDAREETTRQAARGGAPLMDAEKNAVQIGTEDTTTTRTTEHATRATEPVMPARQATRTDGEGPYRLRLREERLIATKTREEAGEVELRKEVVTEQRTIDVPVEREEVFIERHAVNQPASGSITEDGEVIRVPVMEEHAQLEKRTVVTGEVELGKREVQETEHLSGTVRREEARIVTEGDVHVGGETGTDTTTRRTRNS